MKKKTWKNCSLAIGWGDALYEKKRPMEKLQIGYWVGGRCISTMMPSPYIQAFGMKPDIRSPQLLCHTNHFVISNLQS